MLSDRDVLEAKSVEISALTIADAPLLSGGCDGMRNEPTLTEPLRSSSRLAQLLRFGPSSTYRRPGAETSATPAFHRQQDSLVVRRSTDRL